MKRRAKQVAETRLRITEAAVELHGTIGPAATTISAVAQRAGVERLTVYRHFPDEQALYDACTGHWLAQHPFPDPAEWAGIASPVERLRVALEALYGYFRDGRQMLENFVRDAPSVPALSGRAAEWRALGEAMLAVLSEGWEVDGAARRRLEAVLHHVTDLRCCGSLADSGLGVGEAAALMVALVEVAVG